MAGTELTSTAVSAVAGRRSLAVQAVLFQNQKDRVELALESIANSVSNATATVDRAVVRYGDAGPAPLYTASEVAALADRYAGVIELEYRHFGQSTGYGLGQNLLAADSTEDLIFAVKPEVVLAPNCLTVLVELFADPTVGIVDAKQLPLEHPKDYDPTSGETSWASGVCAMVRRDVFQDVGGFDADSFPLSGGDVDLSWQIKELGYQVLHQSAAVVMHDQRLSADGTWEPTETELVHSAWSALILAHKWSRPDVVDAALADWPRSGLDHLTDAVAVYQSRRSQGTLPQPRDAAHRVGQFDNGAHAHHRFPLLEQ